MFGHQDDTQQPQNGQWSQPAGDAPVQAPDPFVATPVSPSAPAPSSPPLIEATETDGLPATPSATPADPSAAADPASADTNNLLDIKQQALQQLSPLVGHLEQSPEEKFRTTMMMIQASDDQSLIPVAYEAANQISDEKARAQALLDIVNEINYFTQH